jgi:hypothetical protein
MKMISVRCDKCGAVREMTENEYNHPTYFTEGRYDLRGIYGIDLCDECAAYLEEHFDKPLQALMNAKNEWLPHHK